MKRILSIPLIILILFSGISLKIATHYCGGNVAATKVSLTGELATCGMESTTDNNLLQDTFRKHCCDDVVSSYCIDNNYIPEFSVSPDPYLNNIQNISIPGGLPVFTPSILKSLFTDVDPPGALFSTDVDLSGICVFRI